MPPSRRLLLDTHALLWWQAGSSRLSSLALDAIATADELLVSPISFWEVAMLVSKGRIALDRPAAAWANDLVGPGGPVRDAGLSPDVAVAAGQLADLHGDPADRIIVATAMAERVPIVSKDRRIAAGAAGHVAVVW
jgi:PIN domain nuclease of toxin-antitoxin system